MLEGFVPLKDLANELGMDRSHARRYVLKLGLSFHQRRTPGSKGQLTLALTPDEANYVRDQREKSGFSSSTKDSQEIGIFYIIQLVPDLDPSRIKFGFTTDLASRLGQHRCSAPTLEYFESWPCRRSWEKTVIDCLTASGCSEILPEVYEFSSLETLRETGNALFGLLPEPTACPPVSSQTPGYREPGE